jgi:hypothetical protein
MSASGAPGNGQIGHMKGVPATLAITALADINTDSTTNKTWIAFTVHTTHVKRFSPKGKYNFIRRSGDFFTTKSQKTLSHSQGCANAETCDKISHSKKRRTHSDFLSFILVLLISVLPDLLARLYRATPSMSSIRGGGGNQAAYLSRCAK